MGCKDSLVTMKHQRSLIVAADDVVGRTGSLLQLRRRYVIIIEDT